jgi:hypothetical protein
MDELLIASCNDDNRLFKKVLGRYDAPAYIRRARDMEESFNALVSRCRNRREEMLRMVRSRFRMLQSLARDLICLRNYVADEAQIERLQRIQHEINTHKGVAITASPRSIRRALEDLNRSIEQFNRRWETFVSTVDLFEVNALRENYNRYYVLEKECVVRSPRIALQGFRPVPPVNPNDILILFPVLPAISLAS